jgi:putative Mg2+ transporter-C (MgtC) family protein
MNIIYIDPIARLLGSWSYELNIYSILFRILLAVLFATIIGCERAHKRHSAGLRTFILVFTACTSAMLLDTYCSFLFGSGLPLISAAAIIGIAIISENSFWYSSRNQIKGLTTGFALWASGFIGMAIGGAFYTAALFGFLATLISLSLLPAMELYLKDKSNHFEVHLELKNKSNLQDFITTIRRLGMKIDDIELNPAYVNSGLSVYSVSITITKEELKKYKQHSEIIEALSTLEYVSYIEEML